MLFYKLSYLPILVQMAYQDKRSTEEESVYKG